MPLSNNTNSHHSEEDLLSLESTFDATKFKYKRVGKQFILLNNGPLHGNAKDLACIFIDQYELLLQRTLRHKIFRRSTLNHKNNVENDYTLTTTSELIGTKCRKCVFGMLCELSEGKIYLQDTQGTVQISLENVEKQTIGLFTYNCFVLCEGRMNNNIFEIDILGFPPYEQRRKTLKTFTNLNFVPYQKQQIMMELEQKNTMIYLYF